jgi:UDP-2,4-diacetamido-2,4,6-trideoxy-beta-L-altropyranose hydrolase
MGTGHVMRCLALAQAWQDQGGDVCFLVAQSGTAVEARLRSENVRVVQLAADAGSSDDANTTIEIARSNQAEWVVVDGYQFDTGYQRSLKRGGCKVLLLDDSAQATTCEADIVLNQNAFARPELYRSGDPNTRLLMGTRYVMLRREFRCSSRFDRQIPAFARKLLVTMGGSDPENLTRRVIEALARVGEDEMETIVIVGGNNPYAESLREAAGKSGRSVSLLSDVKNMSEWIKWADVAITGAGSTSWEMCFLGLPALLIDLAPNQVPIAQELARVGAAIHLGGTSDVTTEIISTELQPLCQSREFRQAMSDRGRELVDGEGAQRVVCAMHGSDISVRRAGAGDCRLLWEWVNDPAVRAASFSRAPIAWQDHQAWFARKISDPNTLLLIGEDYEGQPIGQFRLDWRSEAEGNIDVSVAPGARGSGYGHKLIDLSVRRVFATTSTERVHAFIRLENHASIRAFERAGFSRVGEEQVEGSKAFHYVLMCNGQQRLKQGA